MTRAQKLADERDDDDEARSDDEPDDEESEDEEAEEAEAEPPSEPAPERRTVRAVTADEFLGLELPPRQDLLAPWLPRQGLAMLYARRGVGKTHVALGIAHAVASGGSFLRWQAPKPCPVLYVDGEMPAYAMQERLSAIVRASDRRLPEPGYLRIITPDLQSQLMPSLSGYEGIWAVSQHIRGIGLIVVDNLSTLCRGGRENEAESWLPIQDWALKLRRIGKTVLFVHHAGRSGEQRGTSRREDVLDSIVELRRPFDYQSTEGARFEVHYPKARGVLGDALRPFEARLDTSDGSARWTVSDLDISLAEQMAELLAQRLSIREIASMLGVSKSSVHRFKQALAARESGAIGPRPGVPRLGSVPAGLARGGA